MRPGDNKGEANVTNKLSKEAVLEIYANSTMTQQKLAEKYGVSQSTINHIKKGRIWSWLTGANGTQT